MKVLYGHIQILNKNKQPVKCIENKGNVGGIESCHGKGMYTPSIKGQQRSMIIKVGHTDFQLLAYV